MRLKDVDALEKALNDAAQGNEHFLIDIATVKDIIKQAPTVTVPQWVSVKERLPEESGEILCYAGGSIFSAQYDDSIDDDFPIGFWEQYFDHDTYGMLGDEWNPCDEVTHWMPLPSLPKEDKDNA